MVADVGQGRQGDLPAAAGQHPGPPDEPAGGHDQAGRGPPDVTPDEPDHRQRQGGERDPVDRRRHANGPPRPRLRRSPRRAPRPVRPGTTSGAGRRRPPPPLVEQRARKRHRSNGRRRPGRLRRSEICTRHWLDAGVCTGHTPGLDRLRLQRRLDGSGGSSARRATGASIVLTAGIHQPVTPGSYRHRHAGRRPERRTSRRRTSRRRTTCWPA